MKKTLCSLDKDEIKENIADIASIVSKAKYLCRKCIRASRNAKHLCKPARIEPKEKKSS